MDLKDIGIEVGYLVSGLFGAILMVSKNSTNNIKAAILSIIGGMASANYLTPMMIDMAKITDERMQNGLAFITGFLGLKLVEIVSEKFLKKIEEPQPVKAVRKSTTSKIKK
jgi:hypothetical protein